MEFFVILSGGVTRSPIDLFYFLEVQTSGISPQPENDPSRYTFFAICGVDQDTGRNTNCGKAVAALPFDPRRNFDTSTGIPEAFADNNGQYYTSRVMFAFFLIALFFAVVSLATSLFALCTRIGSLLSGLNTAIAFIFQTIAAGLMTYVFVSFCGFLSHVDDMKTDLRMCYSAWVIKGRNAWRDSNLDAKIGVYSMAFTWSAVACYLLATITYCIGGKSSKERTYETQPSRFGRKRSTRSRGSFLDDTSHHRKSYE